MSSFAVLGKGAQGPPGPAGADGAPGPAGPPGPAGIGLESETYAVYWRADLANGCPAAMYGMHYTGSHLPNPASLPAAIPVPSFALGGGEQTVDSDKLIHMDPPVVELPSGALVPVFDRDSMYSFEYTDIINVTVAVIPSCFTIALQPTYAVHFSGGSYTRYDTPVRAVWLSMPGLYIGGEMSFWNNGQAVGRGSAWMTIGSAHVFVQGGSFGGKVELYPLQGSFTIYAEIEVMDGAGTRPYDPSQDSFDQVTFDISGLYSVSAGWSYLYTPQSVDGRSY